jgi:non-homologous end joining protein Ku
VENLTNKQFDISQYCGEYTKQLEQLINAKTKSGRISLNTTTATFENQEDK